MVINVARSAVSSVLDAPVTMSTVAVCMAVGRVTKVLHVLRVVAVSCHISNFFVSNKGALL